MSADDATWAPQSPSAHDDNEQEFVHPQHHGYRGSISHSLPYSPPTMQDADYTPETDLNVAVSDKTRGKQVKREDANAVQPPAPDVNITVHFPVARIKRIMQADDDVGKVAQVTPVIVCTFRAFIITFTLLTEPMLIHVPAQQKPSNSS